MILKLSWTVSLAADFCGETSMTFSEPCERWASHVPSHCYANVSRILEIVI